MGRIVEYKTGIVAPDGYAETTNVELCDRCDENEWEYERDGKKLCEPCLAEYEQEKAEKLNDDIDEEGMWRLTI